MEQFTVLERLQFYSDLSTQLGNFFTPFHVDLVLLDETHSVLQAEAVSGQCLAKEYKSIARGMGRIGVIPQSMVPTLERMAGYRNRLVHFYHEVTPEELHTIVTNHREDLRTFVRHVRDYLA